MHLKFNRCIVAKCSTGNAGKEATKTKMIKQRKTLEHVGTKRKKKHKKENNTTWGNKPKSTGERRLKRY